MQRVLLNNSYPSINSSMNTRLSPNVSKSVDYEQIHQHYSPDSDKDYLRALNNTANWFTIFTRAAVLRSVQLIDNSRCV